MKTYLKGTLWLSGAVLLSKMIGTLQKVPLQNLAGDEVFGYYNAAYPVYSLIVFLAAAGLPLAVSQSMLGSSAAVWPFWRIRLIGFGLIAGLAMLIAVPLLEQLIGVPGVGWSLAVLAITFVLVPLTAGWRGMLQASGEMYRSAVAQIVEQLIRVAAMLLLLTAGLAMDWSAYALAAAVQAGGFAAMIVIILWWIFPPKAWVGHLMPKLPQNKLLSQGETREQYKPTRVEQRTFWQTVRHASAVAMALPVMQFADALSLPRIIGMESFGVFSRPFVIVQFVTMVYLAVISANVSRWMKRLDQPGGASAAARESIAMLMVLAVPAAIGMFLLAPATNVMFFEDSKGIGVWYILAWLLIPAGLQAATAQMMQWDGKGNGFIRFLLAGAALKWLLNIVWVDGSADPLHAAAWSWIITYMFMAGLQWLHAVKRIRGSRWRNFVQLLGKRALLMTVFVFVVANLTADMVPVNRFGAFITVTAGTFAGAGFYLWLWRDTLRQLRKDWGNQTE